MIEPKAIAIVGIGAILPDAPDAPTFWKNILAGRSSITEVPSNRWSAPDYYDPNPGATDKTYSKIGGWVTDYDFNPMQWGIPIPPRVLSVMDDGQKWAIAAARQALQDYGYPQRSLDPVRTAVILGNAMAGENHYRTSLRIRLPEYLNILADIPDFQNLPSQVQQKLLEGMTHGIRTLIPEITEDTMPGELSNVIAGRVANAFNFSGPNFITDAACASSFAALQAAVEGLISYKFDSVLTGGIDHNMGVEGFVKFCKIGALSPDGSRPYSEGANGFVMGEGGALFLLKRLADAERDGDKIYAVVRGIGASSDGKGKGITAPNPIGQQRAIERAWQDAGLSPASVTLIEGHGTSTRVGDISEISSLASAFSSLDLPTASIALGSVKSNVGHLKAAAGAAGMLKTVMALYDQVLPPSINFDRPNPQIDFAHLPFYVNTRQQPWPLPESGVRRAGVSSFGFGGTNFHIVLEEYLPGVLTMENSVYPSAALNAAAAQPTPEPSPTSMPEPAPVLIPVALDPVQVQAKILELVSQQTGYPVEMLELDLDLEADLGIDTVKQAELFSSVRTIYNIPRREDLRLSDYNTLTRVIGFVLDSAPVVQPVVETPVQPLELPAQPSDLVADTSSDFPAPPRGILFLSAADPQALQQALAAALEQVRGGVLPPRGMPALDELSRQERLAIDYDTSDELVKKIDKTLKAFDTASPTAWQALSGQGVYRGHGTPGKVVFMFPGQGSQYANMLKELRELSPIVAETFREADEVMTPILGRSFNELIFVDDSPAVIAQAEETLKDTTITQPAVLTADIAMMRLLGSYGFRPDLVIGHSLGEYGALVTAGVLGFAEALQIVSARGREMAKVSVADNGAMAAVSAPIQEVERILQSLDGYVVIANVNSPMQSVIGGSTSAVEAAIAAFQAAEFQAVRIPVSHAFHTRIVAPASGPLREVIARIGVRPPQIPVVANVNGKLYPNTREEILDILARQLSSPVQFIQSMQTLYEEGARVLVEVGPKRVLTSLAMDNLKDHSDVTVLSTNHPRKGALPSLNEALCGLFAAGVLPSIQSQPEMPLEMESPLPSEQETGTEPLPASPDRTLPVIVDGRLPITGSVVISGTGLGLPGRDHHVFDDGNIERILSGQNMIDPLTDTARQEMLLKRVTRLNKSEAGATIDIIDDIDRTIKLAGQSGPFDLNREFGLPQERVDATDIATQLAIAAGLEALRDAGIPLVLRYKQTSLGSFLPERWMLPEALADETGVIFGSAFPGLNRMAEESQRFYEHQSLTRQIETLRQLESIAAAPELQVELMARLASLETQLAQLDYKFDRRFIFRVLNMGHSQFAEYIGARGPNTSVNAACATTTHAVSLAEDWIRTGRARRVIVIAGDDITGGNLVEWIGAGLLASGATTTEGNLRMAALPFDRRRNGMIMGMGAAALVVESEDALRERGMRGIAELLSSQIGNSAFHGTRLDVNHVRLVMQHVMEQAEARFGLRREDMAARMVFLSHETYTPARGGSAAAEIHALRHTFGDQANRVIIANTKGFTGHTMGVGIEDVVAVKALQEQRVPPIAHLDEAFEPDPELGDLNLSHGGSYQVDYALRLGAGFGSQLAMTLLRRIPGQGERINSDVYRGWLSGLAGYDQAELETIQRTLRIQDNGVPVHPLARSNWQIGQGPTLWAAAPQEESIATPLVSVAAAPASSDSQEIAVPDVVTTAIIPAPVFTYEVVRDRILEAVSQQTGYPAEMLDLDLDLEADLGIDTVKQAEMFVRVREIFAIPRREDLRLSDYSTLSRVIQFVLDSNPTPQSLPAASDPGLIPAVTASPQPTPLEAAPAVSAVETTPVTIAEATPIVPESTLPAPVFTYDVVKTRILAAVSEQTGYPAEMLDLDLDLEADLGIDTVKQAEMFVRVREMFAIPRREDLRLSDYSTLARVIQFVLDANPTTETTLPTSDAAAPSTAPIALTPVALDMSPALSTVELSPVVSAQEMASIETAPAITFDSVKIRILEAVSEQTGYPPEMLDLDLDLEADLGIDTVKQAELFARVREMFSIPRREDLRLSDYTTLTKVIQFVLDSVPAASQLDRPIETPAVSADAVMPDSSLPRRVPVPVLRPRLDVCKPTGIQFTENLRVIVVHDNGKTGESLARKLRARSVDVLNLYDLTPADITTQAAAWVEQGKIAGVYFLPALDREPSIQSMTPVQWQSENERRVLALYHLMHSLPGDPFLISATRLGGLHACLPGQVPAPLGGAVSGFTKAYAWEHPRTLVKVIDFSADTGATTAAACLLEETLADPGAVEIGMEGTQRYTISLIDQPAAGLDHSLALNRDTVYLITGGSAGISAPILLDLARSLGGKFYLTGRSALPDKNNPDLARVKTDREGLKLELIRRITAAGEKATPAIIEQKLAALERGSAALELLQAIQQTGSRAVYLPCDVTDSTAVEQLFARVVAAEGRIDVILHAAGVDHSKSLSEKSAADFQQVYSTKANGYFNLIKSIAGLPQQPQAVVAFTSIAGRFGNAGQTDYSAANDLLCKLSVALHHSLPHIRFLALDWGAWAEIGMASRGSIPLMMEKAGIEMMKPEDAAPLVRRELLAGTQGEVVLAGGLGIMMLRPRDRDGGLDLERTNQALTAGEPVHVMLSRAAGLDLFRGIILEADLDPAAEPFLKDHALNGIPVLPGVMGIEGFSMAARHVASVLGSDGPGFDVSRLEDIHFLAPFKFYRNQPRRITWYAQVVRQNDGLVAHVSLESTLLSKMHPNEVMLHFTGKVYLEPVPAHQAAAQYVEPPHWNGGRTLNSEDVYKLYFHGPAFQVLDAVQRSGTGILGRMNMDMPPTTSTGEALISAPLLIELCLQTAGIFEAGSTGILALPSAIGEVRLYSSNLHGEALYAQVVPSSSGPDGLTFDARVVDSRGQLYLELKGYTTSPLPYPAQNDLVQPIRRILEE